MFLQFALKSPSTNEIFTQGELSILKSFSEYVPLNDVSNKVVKDSNAIKLGKILFYSENLSPSKKSCASCHKPELAFSDTLRTPNSFILRNTPSLFNTSLNRWFFWDGRSDSHWSQALEPILNPNEIGSSVQYLYKFIKNSYHLKVLYEKTFDSLPSNVNSEDNVKDSDHFFSNIGKCIAAFENTLISNNSRFDKFLAEIQQNKKNTVFTHDEIEGLKLFIGKAKCITCHTGFNLTDNEFHNIKLRQDDKRLDPGRYYGIEILKSNKFNRLGVFSDSKEGSLVTFIIRESKNYSEFKTPSLRNVALTYPYMHDGRFADLKEVLNYYSTLKGSQKDDHHSEVIIQPLGLSDSEKKKIILFLNSLTDTLSYKKRLLN